MTPEEIERRRVERIRLSRPLSGRLGTFSVVLSDLSVLGAGVDHRLQLPIADANRLTFNWRNEELTMDCRVVRSRLEQFSQPSAAMTVYHTGVLFENATPDSTKRLHRLIAAHVTRRHDAQRSPGMQVYENSSAEALLREPTNLNQLFVAKENPPADYICYRFEKNRWRRVRTSSPEQPIEGFTVSTIEGHEQIELLCRTYRLADQEGRRLIRIFAQLSITEPESPDFQM